MAENPPLLNAHFRVTVSGRDLEFSAPAVFRYIDRVQGELTRP